MKHPLSRLLLLLLALTLPLCCACEDGDGSASDSSAAESDVSASVSQTGNPNDVQPEVIDLGGRTINILCRHWGYGGDSIVGFTGEVIYSTEENATEIDVQKKAVVDDISARYHCEINGILDGGDPANDTLSQKVQNMVTSGTFDYDIIFDKSSTLSKMAQNSYLTDLNTVESLCLSNSWWDQNAVEQLSIGGKLFYVNGDINTYDDLGTWCVLFNKSLKERLGIDEDFYQTARDGDWTLDHLIELCKGVTGDANGDGTVDEFDQWAFGTETYNVFVEVLGGGLHVIDKDADDLPYISVKEHPDQLYAALDKIIGFYNSDEVMVANGGKYSQYPNPWEATVNKAFKEGRELFYMCGLINLAAFRDMEDDIGVLPIPKTFADQDTYYHTVSMDNSSYLAIPRNLPNVEELGAVIEALAMKSQQFVTPAFYDKQLKYRDVRDDESAEMLDLMFSTRSFDLGPAYNWGNLMSAYYTLDTDYASRFESLIPAAESAMEDCVESIQAIQ